MESIFLFDTTLRDGQQTTGVNFSVSDKMTIATVSYTHLRAHETPEQLVFPINA